MNSAKLHTEFFKGIWKENPVFVQVLGICPTLAVTTKALFGLSMGLATTFVIVSASIAVSTFRKLIPHQVRIATFTIITATFVTIADLFLKAKFPTISHALGPYVPLIVVNCIILGRQEVFASKNNIGHSLLDAIGMGAGFTIALVILGSLREILGSGAIFGYKVATESFAKWVIMMLPPGAFITLGVLVGLFNAISAKIKGQK